MYERGFLTRYTSILILPRHHIYALPLILSRLAISDSLILVPGDLVEQPQNY